MLLSTLQAITYKMKMNLLSINYSPEQSEKEKDIVENTHTFEKDKAETTRTQNFSKVKYSK